MRLRSAVLLAIVMAAGCGGREEWAPDNAERRYLKDWAGKIARSLVPPAEPADLDPEELEELVAHCDSLPQRYVYLYARIADSIQAMSPPEPACQQTAPADSARGTTTGQEAPDSSATPSPVPEPQTQQAPSEPDAQQTPSEPGRGR